MKSNILKLIIITFAFAALLSSCKEDNNLLDGKGKVNLKMYINDDVKVFARSGSEDDLAANCTIYVYSEKGLIRKFHGVDEIPDDLWLVSGEYKAVAWSGDSVSASFDKKFYKGVVPFSVTKDAVANVNIECKIANVVASAVIDKSVGNVLKDYSIEIGHTKGSLTFNAENSTDAKGYYMMPNGETSLTWTISGTQYNGNSYTQSGTIDNVKSATEYAMTFSYNEETADFGGALISVEVDDTEIDVPDNIEIVGRPKILGVGYDIESPVYSSIGNLNKLSVWISAATALTNIEVSCNSFSQIGVSVNAFDFMEMTEAGKITLAEQGLSNVYKYDEAEDKSTSKISFAKDMLNKLPEGTHEINIKVTDSNGKIRSAILKIVISDALVAAVDVVKSDVWAKKATVYGNIAKVSATNPGFNYRKKGESAWSSAIGNVNGSAFSAELQGLQPGTTYQFVAKCDDFVSTDIKEFITESVFTIPNGNFEQWSTASDNAIMPMPSGQSFWDTGNHGSIKLNKNVTTSDNTIKQSGNYSAKLASGFAGIGTIGKFAAGNLFSGEFGSVNMSTMAATLTFGRTYNNSRPSKLVGYYKYTPGIVDYPSDKIAKDATDIGQIFVALSDKGSPWQIDSGTQSFFNSDASDIIAYGELLATTEVGADGMVRFEIPLSYRSLTRIPNHIILVASASRYGDYFSGSTKSVLWLDDLELIYE